MNLVFCDESGDAGFKFGKGSSNFLNYTFVKFSNVREAEKCATSIMRFLNGYLNAQKFELHFVKESKAIKSKFFKTFKPFDFEVLNFSIDKRLSSIQDNDFLFQAIDFFKKELSNSTIYIDGKSTKQNRQHLETNINKIFKNEKLETVRIKFANSKSDALIQLADMFAGLCHKNLENPNKFYIELQKEFKSRIKQNTP